MSINISDLKDYAHKLMFDMDDLEYETLLKEFDVVLKQMDIISKFDNIDKIEPMVLPFPIASEVFNPNISFDFNSKFLVILIFVHNR